MVWRALAAGWVSGLATAAILIGWMIWDQVRFMHRR
jgi:hypothetical protein